MKRYHIKKSLQYLRRAQLTDNERLFVRKELESFMAHTPMTTPQAFPWWQWKMASVTAIALLLIVTVGGGAALAAEASLPGDILYPIKTAVTEPLRTNLTTTTKAKAEWEMELAERRLREAEELTAQKRLTEETGAQLTTAIKNSAKKIDQLAGSLVNEGKIEDATEVHSRLEGLLRAHTNTIIESDDEPEKNERQTKIIQEMKRETNSALDARRRSEDTATKKEPGRVYQAATNAQSTAQRSLQKVKESVVKKNSSLSESKRATIETRLATADEQFAQGEAQLKIESYGAAFVRFNAVIRTTKEIESILSSARYSNDTRRDSSNQNDGSSDDSNKEDDGKSATTTEGLRRFLRLDRD